MYVVRFWFLVLSASQLLPGKLPALMVGQPVTPNGLGRPRFWDQFVKSASVPWPLGFRLAPTRNSFRNAGVKTCVSEIVVWYTRVSLRPVPKPFVRPSAGEPKRP